MFETTHCLKLLDSVQKLAVRLQTFTQRLLYWVICRLFHKYFDAQGVIEFSFLPPFRMTWQVAVTHCKGINSLKLVIYCVFSKHNLTRMWSFHLNSLTIYLQKKKMFCERFINLTELHLQTEWTLIEKQFKHNWPFNSWHGAFPKILH